MKEYISHSLEETEKIAADWLDLVSGLPKPEEAMVVGLSGHLGSGKTAFTQIVGKMLGIKEIITSPTFVIMKIYEISQKIKVIPWKKLIHIDAYRLESGKEMEVLNFETLVSDPKNLILIEWPENVKSVLLPENLHQNIIFEILDDGLSNKTSRRIIFDK